MKQLNTKDIEKISEIIDGWTGKLTWDALIEEIFVRLMRRYSRQALHRHTRIKQAFDLRKSTLRDGGIKPVARSVELQVALDAIERLKSENQRLEKENRLLLEQFVRWSYNAHCRGLTAEQLNQALPQVDRGRTKL